MNIPSHPELIDRVNAVLGPVGPEITCEECFEQIDRYVELERSGLDAEAEVPGMLVHLHGCPACGEDRDSLHAWLDSA